MSEDNFIDFRCPNCGKTISFPDRWSRTVQDCPWCSVSVVVPNPGVVLGATLPIPIATPRLLLRKLQPDDDEDLTELMRDDEGFRYINWNPLTEDEVERWITQAPNQKLNQPGGYLSLALHAPAIPKTLGFMSIHYLEDDPEQAGFSVMVNKSFRRQGYGTEAVAAALAFWLQGLGLHRVAVSCDTRNMAARRMIEKAGLRQEGEFREDFRRKETWISTAYYAILSSEHMAQKRHFEVRLATDTKDRKG